MSRDGKAFIETNYEKIQKMKNITFLNLNFNGSDIDDLSLQKLFQVIEDRNQNLTGLNLYFGR